MMLVFFLFIWFVIAACIVCVQWDQLLLTTNVEVVIYAVLWPLIALGLIVAIIGTKAYDTFKVLLWSLRGDWKGDD